MSKIWIFGMSAFLVAAFLVNDEGRANAAIVAAIVSAGVLSVLWALEDRA